MKTAAFTVTDNTIDLMSLTGGVDYVKISDGTIDLTDVTASKIYGTGDNYSADTYLAKLTVDGDNYTLTKRDGAEQIENLKITLPAGKTFTTQLPAQITTNGSVTYDGTTYNRIGDKIFSGTQAYEVKDATNILNVTGGTNFVTFENKVIDLSEVFERTIFVDEDFAQVAEFKESVLTVSGEGYGVKIGDGFKGTLEESLDAEISNAPVEL